MTRAPTRRAVLAGASAVALSGLAAPMLRAATGAQVVIAGGGFGGSAAARHLRRIAPDIAVTLVEPAAAFVTCPFSNAVIGGLAEMEAITFGYDGLRAAGVTVVQDRVEAIDADGRRVRLAGGAELAWDRLIVSPGIDIRWDAIEGYGPEAAKAMPHAWKAGAQTALLRDQLQAMPDGGLVVMTVPQNPYRCPPGPYERASLIAHYLKTQKPRSKLIVLDAKDRFSKQPLFQEAWSALYPLHLEWVPFAQNGNLLRVDAGTREVQTEFGRMRGDVVNVIPPQRAGALAVASGLTEGQDWCEVDQATFAARALPGVHVLGDAAIAGAMPKSAFSATAQAKLCAAAIAADLGGTPRPDALLVNTCYSLVSPDWGISVADVFRIGPDGTLIAVEGAGGISPLAQDAGFRQREADYARSWYANMTADTWG